MKLINKTMFFYRKFGKLAFNPFQIAKPPTDPKQLKAIVKSIYSWAHSNGAKYYSFLPYPHTQGIAQKHQTFIDIKYQLGNLTKNIAFDKLKLLNILKGQGDGSSFPNGGLRNTPTARGYLVWDWKSNLFIRKHNRVLYIPTLLITHYGQALDQKTLFRKAQQKLQIQCLSLLKTLGKKADRIFIGMGLEQQFFIIPKKQYQKRIDLSQTGRALIGKMPPHNQQFSDHYYGKIQTIIQKILDQAEEQLFQMGVPVKTRHKEVAPNQFQFQVLREVCDRYGYVPLFHEKPFSKINGSGKHINWSLNYIQGQSNIRNLFNPQSSTDQLFLLFTLIKLKAVLNNQKLYLSSVSVPGNQLRLGGHEAPPRIISAFLGQYVTNMLQKLPEVSRINLSKKIHHLVTDIFQEDTDRNRTSPYAYTSNRYQFRAVGSSQNCLFPTIVILTTIAKQIEEANKLLKQGISVSELINRLVKQTKNIRFQGDGYSQQWINQAKSRNLYVNTKFTDNIENIKNNGDVLVKTGVYSSKQLQAKYQNSKNTYINTVIKETQTLLIILNKNIIPRGLAFIKNNIPSSTTSEFILKRTQKFENIFQKLLIQVQNLQKNINQNISLKEAETLRTKLRQLDEIVNQVTAYLPQSQDWPQLYNILGKY